MNINCIEKIQMSKIKLYITQYFIISSFCFFLIFEFQIDQMGILLIEKTNFNLCINLEASEGFCPLMN